MSFLQGYRPALLALRVKVPSAMSMALTICVMLVATSLPGFAVAADAGKGEIVVVTVHGDVKATMAGVTTPMYAGAILQLPATLRTGRDGSIELRQGPTTIAAAANTELEIPQSALAEGLIERVVQISGNAFYNVGKRERAKLRVETPYLVAVIKGTQFNVAAQPDGTTIALFEGRLEVRATDESDVIDLNAGEIAIRNRGDVSIRVLRMTTVASIENRRPEAVGRSAGSAGSANATDTTTASLTGNAPGTSAGDTTTASVDTTSSSSDGGNVVAQTGGMDKTISAGGGADSGGSGAGAQVDAGVSVGGGAVSASVGTSADINGGAVAASVDSSVSVGSVSADVGASASVDLGAGSVAAGASASVDVGGVVAADAGVGAAVDLGAGTVAADVSAGVSAGPASVDLGAGAAVSVADTSVSAGVDAGVDLGSVSASTGVDASIDPAAGVSVDAGVSVTPVVDVSAGLDVGAGGVAADVGVGGLLGVGVDTSTGTVSVDVGGESTGGGLLGGLGGLLGRPRN